MNKYLTEFKNKDGQAYGWHIMAKSLEEAKVIALERGIGEEIVSEAIIETSSALKDEVLIKFAIENMPEYEELISEFKDIEKKLQNFKFQISITEPNKIKDYIVSYNCADLGNIEVIIKSESIEEARQILSDKGIKDYVFIDNIYNNPKKEIICLEKK